MKSDPPTSVTGWTRLVAITSYSLRTRTNNNSPPNESEVASTASKTGHLHMRAIAGWMMLIEARSISPCGARVGAGGPRLSTRRSKRPEGQQDAEAANEPAKSTVDVGATDGHQDRLKKKPHKPSGNHKTVYQQVGWYVRNVKEGAQIESWGEADQHDKKQHPRHSSVEPAARAATSCRIALEPSAGVAGFCCDGDRFPHRSTLLAIA